MDFVERPAIDMDIQIGDKTYTTEFTLRHQSRCIYISSTLGRRFLKTTAPWSMPRTFTSPQAPPKDSDRSARAMGRPPGERPTDQKLLHRCLRYWRADALLLQSPNSACLATYRQRRSLTVEAKVSFAGRRPRQGTVYVPNDPLAMGF